MSEKSLFYYFGDDEAYFKTLVGDFKKYTKLQIDFKKFFEMDEAKIQSLFLKVYQDKPGCVFIDFSKATQDYLHLARIISRTPMEHNLTTVGLVDYLSPPEVLKESIATNVHLTHIKSTESYDVIFEVVKLFNPKEMGEHAFAKASLNEQFEAGFPVKVGYIHPGGLHFETDLVLKHDEKIKLNHAWLDKNTVPSKEMVVTKTSTQNLFYQFEYAVDAQFYFVDEILQHPEMSVADFEEKKKDREIKIQQHKNKLGKWIDDNLSRSFEKRARVLVIDAEFKFYDHQKRSDKQPYVLRVLPDLKDIVEDLNRMRPHVIAFCLDKEGQESPKNPGEALIKMIETIKSKMPDLSPFIVVFNAQISSKEMQERLYYPHLMSIKDELTVEVLEKMADTYSKKLTDKAPLNEMKRNVYLKKTNSTSLAEILIPITMTKISETDLQFKTDWSLPSGVNLHLTAPVDMHVHIQPIGKTQGKGFEYYGLIHALGETQKKDLRKYVNSIFFRDLDAGKSAELDEFKKLNELKLQERITKEKEEREAIEKEKLAALEEQKTGGPG
jgi:hypothetical protein